MLMQSPINVPYFDYSMQTSFQNPRPQFPPDVDLTSGRPAFQKPPAPVKENTNPKKKSKQSADKNFQQPSEPASKPEPPKTTKLPPVRACQPVSREQQKRGVLNKRTAT